MAKRATKSTLHAWNALLGTWATTGTTLPGRGEKAMTISGTDRYERLLGGAFILHTAQVRMGRKKVDVMEVISYDAATGTYPMHAFDNNGNITTMATHVVSKRVLHLVGSGMRAELVVATTGKTMEARWERCDDGWTWVPWMTMKFVREVKR